MSFRRSVFIVVTMGLLATDSSLMSQETTQSLSVADKVKASKKTPISATTTRSQAKAKSEISPTVLPAIVVTSHPLSDRDTPPVKERYQLPQTTQSITAERIQESVNVVDAEDTIKYFPSLFLRKRNNGDTQATLETRTWGVNSSARSLVYADDILLSALIGNNNTNAAPRWGMVSPQEIERIDFLYGPFAAAYPGNSMGGALLITTKMPEKLVAAISQTETFQDFNLYGTKDVYRTDQTNIFYGDKKKNISWLFTGNYQNSYSQPLYLITNGSIPEGTTGAYPGLNKTGATADVVGAGGVLHSQVFNTSGKISWDITSSLKATYQVGFYDNDTRSQVQSYLSSATGSPTFGGVKGFASDDYMFDEKHLANSISLKTDTGDLFDWDFSVSNYYYLEDIQRNPYGVTGNSFTANGTIARLDGTNWTNGDFKVICRPTGPDGPNEISFGLHGDRYYFDNPTYGTPTWSGGPDSTSSLYTEGQGTTMTEALWVQDAWRFAPNFKLTLGGRLEFWEASDGFNLATTQNASGAIARTTSIHQPDLEDTRFSPKASLSWTPSPEWEITGSFGQAYRFPTVTELYQTVSTGPILSNPNPNLKPENVWSEEFAVQRKFSDGNIRLSFFNENVDDAIISQTNFVSGQTPISFVTNVDAIRNTGVELAIQKDHILFHGLTFFGSATYVNSEILRDPSFASAAGTSATGKRVPYVPDWRATLGVTYHLTDRWAFTAAARYSGRQYTTLDNSDNTSHVFGAFDSFVVADLRAEYKFGKQIFVDAGIDNVNNEKYFLYHPFPQRTYTAQVKIQF